MEMEGSTRVRGKPAIPRLRPLYSPPIRAPSAGPKPSFGPLFSLDWSRVRIKYGYPLINLQGLLDSNVNTGQCSSSNDDLFEVDLACPMCCHCLTTYMLPLAWSSKHACTVHRMASFQFTRWLNASSRIFRSTTTRRLVVHDYGC